MKCPLLGLFVFWSGQLRSVTSLSKCFQKEDGYGTSRALYEHISYLVNVCYNLSMGGPLRVKTLS